MSTILGPINITNPNVSAVTPNQGLTDLSDKLHGKSLTLEQFEDKVAKDTKAHFENFEKQINTPNNTVVKLNDEIIATFSESGYQTFFNNSDSRLVPPSSNAPRILDALGNKYGNALSIIHYPPGEGPTDADISEEKYGHRPQKPINIQV